MLTFNSWVKFNIKGTKSDPNKYLIVDIWFRYIPYNIYIYICIIIFPCVYPFPTYTGLEV